MGKAGFIQMVDEDMAQKVVSELDGYRDKTAEEHTKMELKPWSARVITAEEAAASSGGGPAARASSKSSSRPPARSKQKGSSASRRRSASLDKGRKASSSPRKGGSPG